jgi:hypothetical protein
MLTDEYTMDEDAVCVARNECPICRNGRRGGSVNPRRALQEHLRRCKGSKHKLWYTELYKTHFVRGGDMTKKRETTAVDIVLAVKQTFGEGWANRVHID